MKIGLAHKGIPRSADTRMKLSLANRGKKANTIARKKMSLSQRGRKHSAATRKKMSEIRKRIWAVKKQQMWAHLHKLMGGII